MVIKELYLENFGKFKQKSVHLTEGINLIQGQNEAGKTTIHDFVRGMLFGLGRKRGRGAEKDDYTRYAPWDNPDYYKGMMRFELDGVCYRMERNFSWTKRNLTVIRESDGYELTEAECKELLGGFDETRYANTVSIGQLGAKPGEELEDVFRDYVVNLASTKNAEMSMKHAVDSLQQKKKEYTSVSKPKAVAEKKTELLKVRAQLESLEKKEEELCEALDQKKEVKAALDLQWKREKKVETQAKEALDRIQQTCGTLREKKKDLEQAASQLEQDYGSLKGEIASAKEKLNQTYGFSSLEEAATEIMKTKSKRIISIPLIILAIVCMAAAVTTFVMELLVYFPILATAAAVLFAIACICVGCVRAKQKEARLDFLDEGRMELMKIREEEKRRDRLKEDWEKKKANLAAVGDKLTEQEQKFKDKSENLPEVSKKLITDMEKNDQEIQRIHWDLEQLTEKEEELEQVCDGIKEELSYFKSCDEEVAAIDLAIEHIQAVAEEIKGSFGVTLNELASRYISAITKGKYTHINVDDHMNITVYDGAKRLQVSQLSKGTIEQMYLALRLAASDVIFEKSKKPILLDDALVMYDNKRMAEALRCLADHMEQTIIFSCHTREKAVLDAMGISYNYIRMD